MQDDQLVAGQPTARAMYAAAAGRAIFVWHHQPPRERRRSAAIVLCPPIGYEYMSAYRSWRLLAERLTARGFDVFRFDYEGTGNSTGGPEEPDRPAAWLGSVSAAIGEAQRLAGTDRIALVGLRAGSLLALQAASDSGAIERLALWSPFASGRAYVRELKAIARLNAQVDEADGPGVNADGHIVTEDTINALQRWSVAGLRRRPATHVLLLERDDRHADSAIDTHLRELGSRVDRISVPGTAEMLLPPHLAKIPGHALDTLVNWFEPWHDADISPDVANQVATVPKELRQAGYVEQPVQFGPDGRLFGIITRPTGNRRKAPSIVLLSTGGGHHVGPHRLYVPMSREWAADGHLVFRFDLGGIGDSMPPAGAAGGDAYPAHRIDDAREAVALARKEAPDQPVILMGLCSGGWLAFEAARAGLAIDAIISINPPLYLRDGRGWVRQQRQFERYQRSLRNPAKWLRAIRSGASAALALRTLAQRAGRNAASKLTRLTGDRLPDGLATDLQAIARRNIRAFFIFSNGDNGHLYFEQHAPHALRRDDIRRAIHHVVVDDAGHVFRPQGAQRRLRVLVNEFVSRVTHSLEERAPQNATWTRRPV